MHAPVVYESVDHKRSDIFPLTNQMRKDNVDFVVDKQVKYDAGEMSMSNGKADCVGWTLWKASQRRVWVGPWSPVQRTAIRRPAYHHSWYGEEGHLKDEVRQSCRSTRQSGGDDQGSRWYRCHHDRLSRLATTIIRDGKVQTHVRIQKVLPEWGPTLTSFYFHFFSENEGERIQILVPLKVGHHRPASETPFKWRFAGGPMMAQHWMLAWFFRGSGPVFLKNMYFCYFSVVGLDPLSPSSRSAHATDSDNKVSPSAFTDRWCILMASSSSLSQEEAQQMQTFWSGSCRRNTQQWTRGFIWPPWF